MVSRPPAKQGQSQHPQRFHPLCRAHGGSSRQGRRPRPRLRLPRRSDHQRPLTAASPPVHSILEENIFAVNTHRHRMVGDGEAQLLRLNAAVADERSTRSGAPALRPCAQSGAQGLGVVKRIGFSSRLVLRIRKPRFLISRRPRGRYLQIASRSPAPVLAVDAPPRLQQRFPPL